jgi:hypothetical protein
MNLIESEQKKLALMVQAIQSLIETIVGFMNSLAKEQE